MTTKERFLPGMECAIPGQYEIVDVDGTMTGIERTVSLGEPFPPTLRSGQSFVLVDETRREGGGGPEERDSRAHFRPGERCKRSGQYEIVNADGTLTGQERNVVYRELFPDTPLPDQTFVLVDATYHKGRAERGPVPARPDPKHAYPVAHNLGMKAKDALGVSVPVRIYVQSPTVAQFNPEVGIEEIKLDWEPNLMDGPTSARIAVVDYDGDTGELYLPVRWDRDSGRFLDPEDRDVNESTYESRWFRQVNVWAIVQRVLDFYEDSWDGGLGRTIPWAFEGNRLIVVPHAGLEVNACYDRHSKSIQCYYSQGEETTDYSCLSHDIVAHETGHAILDGIRPYYYENTSLETRAFHEYVADLTAILTAMRNNDLRWELGRVTKGRLTKGNFLSKLGEVFGQYTENREYIRNAVQDSKVTMRDIGEGKSPHYCSQVLTGAMWDIMAEMVWGDINREKKTTKEALWDVIDSIRRIALWPLDFLPPVDVQFVDYARAVLRVHWLSDAADRHGLRGIMRRRFAERGLPIEADDTFPHITPFRHRYDINRITRSRADAYRFLHDHRRELCIPAEQDLIVPDPYESGPIARGMRRLSRRVIQYVWKEEVEISDPGDSRFRELRVPLWCGGTLVFDDGGNLLSWVRKPGAGELKCPDGRVPARRCKQDTKTGRQRREKLLGYVNGQIRKGWVGLLDEGQEDHVDVAWAPIAGRQTGGLLSLEARPAMRHWGAGGED